VRLLFLILVISGKIKHLSINEAEIKLSFQWKETAYIGVNIQHIFSNRVTMTNVSIRIVSSLSIIQ